MAPKKSGKKKGPTYYTTEADLEPFGFKLNDIIRTPLGVTGTVIGVKYENPEQKETGRVWVKYDNAHEAPLEPRLGAGYMSALGYRRCSEADHIRRDVETHVTAAKKVEEERKLVEQIKTFQEQGLPIPAELLPQEKPKKKKAEKKK